MNHDKAIATLRAHGRQLTLGNRTMCFSEWARVIGITRKALQCRLSSGWPLERALTEGRGKAGPRSIRLLASPIASRPQSCAAPDRAAPMILLWG